MNYFRRRILANGHCDIMSMFKGDSGIFKMNIFSYSGFAPQNILDNIPVRIFPVRRFSQYGLCHFIGQNLCFITYGRIVNKIKYHVRYLVSQCHARVWISRHYAIYHSLRDAYCIGAGLNKISSLSGQFRELGI